MTGAPMRGLVTHKSDREESPSERCTGLCVFAWRMEQGAFQQHSLIYA